MRQLSVHLPLEHTLPAGQTVPHAPQFLMSFMMLTHAPPQLVRPVQRSAHLPATQSWSREQAAPQAPQLSALVIGSMQTAPQITVAEPLHLGVVGDDEQATA